MHVENLTQVIGEQATKIFGEELKETELKPDDPRVKTFIHFIDNLIKNGYGVVDEEGNQHKFSAGEVMRATTNMFAARTDLQQAMKGIIDDKKDAHLTGKETIAKEILSHYSALSMVTDTIDTVAAANKKPAPAYEDASIAEVRNIFYSQLQNIYAETKGLSDEDRSLAFADRIDGVIAEMHENYGSELMTELSSSIKDASAVSYAFAVTSEAGVELPALEGIDDKVLEANEEIMLAFSKGDYSSLSADAKKEVLNIISEIAQNGGELSTESVLKLNELESKEGIGVKLFYEHLRQESAELNSAGSLEDFLSMAVEKLPDLIMPAIIGAVIGYLTGGASMLFGAGAVAISILGSGASTPQVDTDEIEGNVLQLPPAPNYEPGEAKTVETQVAEAKVEVDETKDKAA